MFAHYPKPHGMLVSEQFFLLFWFVLSAPDKPMLWPKSRQKLSLLFGSLSTHQLLTNSREAEWDRLRHYGRQWTSYSIKSFQYTALYGRLDIFSSSHSWGQKNISQNKYLMRKVKKKKIGVFQLTMNKSK